MNVRPAGPAADSILSRCVRWLLRGIVVAAMVALAERMERGLDTASLAGAAFAAGIGAAVLLLLIGALQASRGGMTAGRTLDWLLLGPWTVLFVLALWWLEGLLDIAPVRALLAAAAATLGSVVLTLLGLLMRRGKSK